MDSLRILFTGPEEVALEVEQVPEPGPGELLLKATVTLISTGTESICYRGNPEPGTHWADWIKYPFEPGYSWVGRVAAVGEGVEGWQVGERVCSSFSHRQYVLCAAESAALVRIPDAVSDESASWSVLNFVAQTAVRRVEHAVGDTAVVIGLGPLGQLAVQFLRLAGLQEVLAVDTEPRRLEMARAHGATAAFTGSAADAKDFVLEHTEGRLADVVYDVTGHWAVLPLALPLARNFGKVVLLGDSPEPSKQHLTRDVLTRQVDIIGTHNAKLAGRQAEWGDHARQMRLFLQYLERGQMRTEDLITHRHSPREAAQVYADLQTRRGETMGVLFDWAEV